MNFARISKSLAVAGVTSAMAAGALVGATTTSAIAAPVTSTYTCPTPLGTFDVPVSVDVTSVPATMPAGKSIAAGGSPVSFVFEAPAELVATLATVGGLSALSSPDFKMPLGSSAIPVTDIALSGPPVAGANGAQDLPAAGTSGAYKAPAAGTKDLMMPSSFTLVPTTGAGPIPVTCTTSAPAKVTTVSVTKNASTTSAKPATTPFHHTKVAKMNVTVAAANHRPTGKVLVKQGTKTLGSATLNSLGKAVVSIGKLSVGKHNLVVLYNGDGYTTSSKKAITVKAVR